jgi:restriction system protein
MRELAKGANVVLAPHLSGITVVRAVLSWQPMQGVDVDASALLLGPDGKVRSDKDFVFYNTPRSADGSVRHEGKTTSAERISDVLQVNLPAVPSTVHRIVLAASLDAPPEVTFGRLANLQLQIEAPAGSAIVKYVIADASTETAFVCGELYRRGREWKFRAVGQGWDSGLAGLATDFGITVDDDSAAAPPTRPAAPVEAHISAPRANFAGLVARTRQRIAAERATRHTDPHEVSISRAMARSTQARAHTFDVEGRRRYKEVRNEEVAARNAQLQHRVDELKALLHRALAARHGISPDRLKPRLSIPPFGPGVLNVPEPEPMPQQFIPPEPAGLSRLFGGRESHLTAVRTGQDRYAQAQAAHDARERVRLAEMARARAAYDAQIANLQRENAEQHREVDLLWEGLAAKDPRAVAAYFELILASMSLPSVFPQRLQIAYVPDSRQLVVEYELPKSDIVPPVKSFKWVQTTDAISEAARSAIDAKALYGSVLAQTTLAVLYTLFAADRHGTFDTLVFNGIVDTTDPATGHAIQPCLVTLRTTRDVFGQLDLAHVEPAACLRHLGAGVSKSPTELIPVRPVIEFSMVDPRFIDTQEVLSGLDQRTNLMDLSPGEFEGLITNLFSRMGLEARQTQASRDGGVDCVAFDPRPIFGGKVIIQAKRYKNTVGVSAVRDLFGTLQNEGASKGILVTTSGYGQACYEFASGKPIELIDGANLLYLLAEHANVEARIQPPDDWRDPRSQQ